jgi:PAS domain S-box-containing protein
MELVNLITLMHRRITLSDYLKLGTSIVIILNQDEIVEYINPVGKQLLGFTYPEIVGKNWFYKFVAKDFIKIERLRFKLLLNGDEEGKEAQECYIKTKAGNERLIRWKCMDKKDKRNNSIAVIYFGEDISEKRILQERLTSLEQEKQKLFITAILEAQEKERFYIANELHDNVGQILTTCKLLLEGVLKEDKKSICLKSTYEHLQNAINEIRSLSHQLNPGQLHEIGLVNAIKELIAKVNTSGKLLCELKHSNKKQLLKLNKDVALSLFRITQEQINNIIKHAKATTVEIRLFASSHSVELEISDNGVGFSLNNIPRGLGLRNIYNRTELFGGKAVLNTGKGEGCTLIVYIPISEKTPV